MFGVRKEQYIKLGCIRMGKQENKKQNMNNNNKMMTILCGFM